MSLYLFQADPTSIDWTQFGVAGGAIFIVVAFLIFFLKIVPSVVAIFDKRSADDKEIKLAELEIRRAENETRGKEAESRIENAQGLGKLGDALTTLGSTLGQLGSVLENVIVEQHHGMEKLLLLQRVNAESSDQVMASVKELADEVATIKDAVGKIEGDRTRERRKSNGTHTKTTPTE
jgi:predicted  nucleic acid-binding Zn-ribbon protein